MTGRATCANGRKQCPAPRPSLAFFCVELSRTRPGSSCGAGIAAVAPAPASAAPVSRFSRIETELSALRGLRFKSAVPSSTQSRADFRAWVHAELGRELPPKKSEGLSHAYADLGLAPQGFDLTTTLEDALTTQVAAYYDPRSKAFRVVGETRGEDVDGMIVAHELTHALDDQYFDLETFDGGEGNRLGLSEDERTARDFVTEGEATFLMLAWQSASGEGTGKRLGPLGVAAVRMAVAMLGAADPLELLAAARRGRSVAELSPEERRELDEMTRLPPLVSLPLIEPYFKGAALVSEVWGRGGWGAVGDLYRHPPASTEQILHAREKFLDHRDPPILMSLPAARPGLSEPPVATEVLGELGMRAYFKTWDFPTVEVAAAGWGGDRFWVWKRAGQFTVSVGHPLGQRERREEIPGRISRHPGTTLSRDWHRACRAGRLASAAAHRGSLAHRASRARRGRHRGRAARRDRRSARGVAGRRSAASGRLTGSRPATRRTPPRALVLLVVVK